MKKQNKIKVAIIGTVGIPAKYGGFETLAEYLVKELNEEIEFTVYCSKKAYKDRPRTVYNAKAVYIPLEANGISSIFYDLISILHAVFKNDTLLILGVSAAFIIPFLKIFTKKKIVTNIDGLEWKRDKWGGFTKKYLKSQERIAVQYSAEVVADNKAIQDYVYEEYSKKSNLIAYGSDHVKKQILNSQIIEKYKIPKDFFFKVCRIEPENNIHIILEAFNNSNQNIVFIGNWNNSDYGRKLKEQYDVANNIYLLDPIYNQEILNSLRSNCLCYVHGHSAGGTNPSLVEAMYLGLPIIAFDVNYNRFTTNNEAIYFETAHELLEKIDYFIENEKERIKIGVRMKRFSEQKYTWKFISDEYKKLLY